MLKSGLKSMLNAKNDLVSKLEAALSLNGPEEEESEGVNTSLTMDSATGRMIRRPHHENTYPDTTCTGGEGSQQLLSSPSEHERAAEMFLFGPKKLRFPNFKMALSFDDYTSMVQHHKRRKDSTTSGRGDAVDSVEVNGDSGSKQETVPEETSSEVKSCKTSLAPPLTTPESEHSPSVRSEVVLKATGPDPFDKFNYRSEAPASSGSGSDQEGYGPSTSLESDCGGAAHHNHGGNRMFGRSGSEGSILSWISSLSCDSQPDDAVASEHVAFMKAFVGDIFKDSTAIDLARKSKFGQVAQLEIGRLWFSRLVNACRASSKCVGESTFYGLIQYFAIVLFECLESDDFSPAKTLMNMCFTFYHEVEVPGCEPYKEYLCTYLKDHPVWHSLRFWNAAFFDALQCERAHKPVVTREDVKHFSMEAITDEQRYQENITFGQLGSFTCNMHAFGLSKELCLEFLRKQCTIANLQPEQEKMLMENIERMYRQTDPWR